MSHVVRIIREVDSGMRRGVCSCGATYADRELDTVVAWANTTHERPTRAVIPEQIGFVSGLPIDLYGWR